MIKIIIPVVFLVLSILGLAIFIYAAVKTKYTPEDGVKKNRADYFKGQMK